MMTKDLRPQTDRRYICVLYISVCVCVCQRDLSGLSQMPSTCLESLSHPVQTHKAVYVCVCVFESEDKSLSCSGLIAA